MSDDGGVLSDGNLRTVFAIGMVVGGVSLIVDVPLWVGLTAFILAGAALAVEFRRHGFGRSKE